MRLHSELQDAIKLFEHSHPDTFAAYHTRLMHGQLTCTEDPVSHFCVYFLPFNTSTGEVLIGAHKKSGKWISPGGHMEGGEGFLETLNREIEEELGVSNFYEKTRPVFTDHH